MSPIKDVSTNYILTPKISFLYIHTVAGCVSNLPALQVHDQLLILIWEARIKKVLHYSLNSQLRFWVPYRNILANPLKQAFDVGGNGGALWKPSQFVSPDRSRQHFKIKGSQKRRSWIAPCHALSCGILPQTHTKAIYRLRMGWSQKFRASVQKERLVCILNSTWSACSLKFTSWVFVGLVHVLVGSVNRRWKRCLSYQSECVIKMG